MHGRSLTTAASIALCLTLSAGCSPKVIREASSQPVPSELEERCVPAFEGSTYRDLVAYTLRVREAAWACETDKKAAKQALGG